MAKFHIKKDDQVIVLAGSDKGRSGKVLKVLVDKERVLVEGINMVTKHVKPSAQNENGGIIKVEAPIHASNVMILDPKTKKRTRIGHMIDKNGKKIRISKKSNESLD